VHVTEVIIYDLFLGYNTRYNNSSFLGEFIVYVDRFQPRLFSAPEIFITDV